MSAVLQKANSGPLANIPVHATVPIVMKEYLLVSPYIELAG